MAVSHDDVRNAFRFILGRPPEDKRVVKFHSGHASVSDLRLALLSSTEFRDQGFITPTKAFSAFDPPKTIEIEADEITLKTIITKMEAYWSEIGKYAPHYSVLTDDRYTPGRLNENEAAFWETGTSDRDFILALLRRTGRSASEFRCCVDYGCGIGRTTVPLAATFPEVIALDISRPHLEIAQNRIKSSGASNVHFLQVTPENVMPAVNYDLWFSRLVLQHNPPPVTLAILEKAFAGLSRNGVAIIHLRTYDEGYSFRISDYLAGNLGQAMEMHVTPQRPILELAFRHNCCLCEVHEEPGHRTHITNIFVFQKM